MTRKLKHCSECNQEVETVKKSDFDKLLKASLNTPSLTLKELKARLKREREGRKNSK